MFFILLRLMRDPRYLRFNVLVREDAKVLQFTDVVNVAALSPQSSIREKMAAVHFIFPVRHCGPESLRKRMDVF